MRAGQVGGARHEGGTDSGYRNGGPCVTHARVDVTELVRPRTRHPETVAKAVAMRSRRPLMDGTLHNSLGTEAVTRSVAVVEGLGGSSAYRPGGRRRGRRRGHRTRTSARAA
ncbi:hypothetical protein AAW14_25300 [Streptomyces hygroscopicus]|uniref:hypothetical protein n=1 Tax=Streptomyces hygroscopicus TaxID=1912 RepID=UPI0022407BA1|nr:hypothetical protein [Streptomyces hygroscopicus]MCW7945229.1 hypothetical protein [Streptomyces hygroscopicus]